MQAREPIRQFARTYATCGFINASKMAPARDAETSAYQAATNGQSKIHEHKRDLRSFMIQSVYIGAQRRIKHPDGLGGDNIPTMPSMQIFIQG
jgi:hypothetical protein